MLVSDLKESLQGVDERSIEATFAGLTIDDDCRTLKIDDATAAPIREFQFDEQLERTLSKYLGVSKSYLAKCPPDLKAHNLNYWLDQKPGVAAVVEVLSDHVVSIHKPGLVILPIKEVADVITNSMQPTDEIVQLLRNESQFHIDIVTPKGIEVDVDNRIADRQQGERQIGDVTRGGVRVLSSPTEVKAPIVQTYLHRLWCTNGCTSPVDEGTIKLKGNTVDEVLAEMNEAMIRIRGELDDKLASYAEMAARRPPGSPVRFARQLGNEYGIPARVMTRVLDRVEILPEDATLYDIQQVFTQTANGSLPYRTMVRLQSLAGDMAMDTEHVVHRCGTCERLLPE